MAHRCQSESPACTTTVCPVSRPQHGLTIPACDSRYISNRGAVVIAKNTPATSASSLCHDTKSCTWRWRAVRPPRTRLRGLRTALFIYISTLLWCHACATTAAIKLFDDSVLVGGYNEIVYDRTSPPPKKVRLIRRAVDDVESGTTTTSMLAAVSSSLPTPFDSSLGNNFTEASCPAFFQSFLSNSAFHDCIPFSLLLQTSTAFFTAEQSPVLLTQTLEATCNVNLTVCDDLMASLAKDIQLSSNCGADLRAENPTVLQAYNGLTAYKTMYYAGCLQDSNTGTYCFSDAVTNSSQPTASYIYYLPLGVPLPSNTVPTCSTCLQDTMAVFAIAATEKSQPISSIYSAAAGKINAVCGAGFVNTSVVASSSSAASIGPPQLAMFGKGGFSLLWLLGVALMSSSLS